MSRQEIQLLKNFAGSHRLLLGLAFTAGTAAGFASLLIPLSIGKYYALALGTGSPRGKIFDMLPIEVSNLDTFFLFFGLVILLYGIASYLARQFADKAAETFVKELREKLFARQLRQPLDKVFRRPVGRYLLRYSGDMGSIKRLMSRGMIGMVKDIILLMMGIVLLIYLNLALSMLILGLTSFFMIVFWIINHMLLPGVNRLRSIRSSNLAFVGSRFEALMTIKMAGREGVEVKKFEKRSDKMFQQAMFLLRRENLQRAMVPFLLYGLLMGVLFYGSVLLKQENTDLDGASLLVFIMFLITIIPPIRRLLYVRRHWRDGMLSLSKVMKVFQEDEDIQKKQLSRINTLHVDIHPFNLDFDNGKVLHFHGLSLKQGVISFLKGPSGSGKTLLLSMLAGLKKAPQGSIMINGTDASTLSLESLRSKVSLFSSEAPLLGNTIAGVLGNPRGQREDQARERIQYFGMHLSVDDSLKIDIGSGGYHLSSGEQNILKLVRMLINPRPLMLLDDPFSKLDKQNVHKLLALLDDIKDEHCILLAVRDDISPTISADSIDQHGAAVSLTY